MPITATHPHTTTYVSILIAKSNDHEFYTSNSHSGPGDQAKKTKTCKRPGNKPTKTELVVVVAAFFIKNSIHLQKQSIFIAFC